MQRSLIRYMLYWSGLTRKSLRQTRVTCNISKNTMASLSQVVLEPEELRVLSTPYDLLVKIKFHILDSVTACNWRRLSLFAMCWAKLAHIRRSEERRVGKE